MNKGWLIYRTKDAKQNRSYIEWFISEAEKAGMRLSLILREELKIGIINNQRIVRLHENPVELPDFAIVRTIEPILNAQLESLGIPVFNSAEVASICNDKSLTHHYVQKLNVPMVDTYFYCKEDLQSDEIPLPYPFVLKEAFGRGGNQVYFIEDESDWLKTLNQLSDRNIIVQSSNVLLGQDLRVFVIGHEIIGAVLRQNTNDFRANFKLGGSAQFYHLKRDEKEMISNIINHFQFGMVGIDFLIHPSGELLFNEIEDVVGSRTLSNVSEINILEKYIHFIKNNLT
jgi:gamma-F420-2:alpha-L-glutamate ligase